MHQLLLQNRTGISRKNGSVELLRFLFTSVIIFFHINLDLWDQQKVVAVIRGIPVTFFQHGNIAVEFFFLVTGWLMARSVYQKIMTEAGEQKRSAQESGEERVRAQALRAGNCVIPDFPGLSGQVLKGKIRQVKALAEETLQFVAHKARAILPFYLAACALTPLVRLATDRSLTLEYFALRMPSLLFLQRTGLGKPFIGCTWYISSMLIGLVLAYPLCRRFYRFYTCFAGPVLGFALLGAIMVLTGGLGDIDDWFFITYKTNVRAFAEISVGAGTFEISRRISTWFARRKADLRLLVCRWILTLTALTGLALSVVYMCSAMEGRYALIIFCLLAAAVAIVFSGEGVLSHAGIFGHPVFAWLGRISLPMYVSQTLFRRSVPYWFDRSSEWKQCLMIYLGILLFAMLMDGTARLCRGRRVRIPVRLYRRKIS